MCMLVVGLLWSVCVVFMVICAIFCIVQHDKTLAIHIGIVAAVFAVGAALLIIFGCLQHFSQRRDDITVYNVHGDVIKKYENATKLKYHDGGIEFEDGNKKHYIYFDKAWAVIINEK